jgi:hypothetical protein
MAVFGGVHGSTPLNDLSMLILGASERERERLEL